MFLLYFCVETWLEHVLLYDAWLEHTFVLAATLFMDEDYVCYNMDDF